jgi:drug/metabolite transporter (DMT)-like permease
MSRARLVSLTLIALLAFAGNSLLCRAAFTQTTIDPASFTALRLLSGAITLAFLVVLRTRSRVDAGVGNWTSALALFAYAAGFSFAYVHLSAGVGALILFGSVQTTMIADGLYRGERMGRTQVAGLALACGGLVGLLLPGLSAPPLWGAAFMVMAGVAWGVYSLRGRGVGDPLRVTTGNFVRAAILGLILSGVSWAQASGSTTGAMYAVLSGAIASGLGYAIWYAALPALRSTTAATVQLSVPLIAAVGGLLLLGEAPSLRLLLASVAILGGIAMVVLKRKA